MTEIENDESLSSYEKLRLENIKRNEEFLKQVGLSPNTSNIRQKSSSDVKKKKNTTAFNDIIEPTRKSRRIEALPVVSYDMKIIDKLSSIEDSNDNINDNIDKIKRHKPISSGPRPPPSSDMSRAINAQLSDVLSNGLGQHIAEYGKAAVMAMCNNGTVPRFSKYSGVVEWKNAIFLWVNLGHDKSQYPNTFSEQGKYITWFGGSKMHEDSEVIKRLITLGKTSYKGDDQIILFVRKEGESYVCLGRLVHVDYKLDINPVTFRWQLLDYDNLKDIDFFKSIIKM